jgi:hypothetical protein
VILLVFMDPRVHKRYLDYRELFVYFGRKITILTAEEFAPADAEYRALEVKRKLRTEAEEARFRELASLLFRD